MFFFVKFGTWNIKIRPEDHIEHRTHKLHVRSHFLFL